MQSSRMLVLVGVLSVSPVAANATLTFDFEGLSAGGNGALVANGFVFDAGDADWHPGWSEPSGEWIGHYHIADPTDTSRAANNGSKYFIFDYFRDDSRLNIYGESGQTFGMSRLDLAEWEGVCRSSAPPELMDRSCGVTFVGQLSAGGTVSRHLILDGIADGAGGLDDFQTFAFDEQWDGLTMFSIVSSHGYLNPGLDNVVLRAVPEPATWALLGCGAFGAFALRRRLRGKGSSA
jgi:hypothetical protein